MPDNSFKITKNRKDQTDRLTVHRHKKNVKGSFCMIRFIDKDTKQIVYYVPSLEITGYGSTDTQTLEIVKFSILEWFKFIISLSQKKKDQELISLGWKKIGLQTKNSQIHSLTKMVS